MNKREIKFRAWTRQGEWDDSGENRQFVMIDADSLCLFESDLLKDMLQDIDDEWYVMQFTGLKDKNGKEIYEGDVLDYPMFYDGDCKELAGRGFVQWNEEQHYIAKVYPNGEEGYLCSTWDMAKNNGGEIIGNIYENPELLK